MSVDATVRDGDVEGVPDGDAPEDSVPDGEGVFEPDGEHNTGS